MRKLFKVIWLMTAAAVVLFGFSSSNLFAVNSVRLECPITKPVVDGDSIPIKIFVTNDVPLSAFSIGFIWDKTEVTVTSAKKGAGFPVGLNFQKGFRPAERKFIVGMVSMDPELWMDPSTDAHVATVYMRVPIGTPPMCVDIDSSIVGPAGYFIFSPTAGGSISPDYIDCGKGDILIARSSCGILVKCKSVTVEAGANCSANADINDGTTGVDSLKQVPAGPYPFGVTHVKLIAFSGADKDSCFADVTVQDHTKPTISCPANIVKNNDPGTCGAVTTFEATAADNCAGVSALSTPASGSIFPVGVTNVWSVATDANGNKDSCSFTVTVNDTTKPIITFCPKDTIIHIPDTETHAILNYTPTATDNCPGVIVGGVPASGSSFPIGTTPVAVTALDAHGNSATCGFNVTVAQIVTPHAVIKITPDTLNFTAFVTGPNPADQGVIITNIGAGALDWIATKDSSWLSLTSSSGSAPSGFTVKISTTGMSAGTYSAEVSVSSAQANNSPQKLVVILHLNSAVDIRLTPDSLDFYAKRLGPNPPNQTVTIENGGLAGVQFNWGAVETSPWLDLLPSSGTTPSTAQFIVDITGLPEGKYSTLVIIKELSVTADVTHDIDTVIVTLTVDKQTGVDDNQGTLPTDYNLAQNYPNPFNPETVIEFNLPVSGHVTLTVFNIIGQKVKDIINENLSSGNKRAVWDGRDAAGNEVQSGVYFYRLTADKFNMTRKMMLLK